MSAPVPMPTPDYMNSGYVHQQHPAQGNAHHLYNDGTGNVQPEAPFHAHDHGTNGNGNGNDNDNGIPNSNTNTNTNGHIKINAEKSDHPNINDNADYHNQHNDQDQEDADTYPDDLDHDDNDLHSEYEDYAEPIKLFVGQVPKSMEEADLFPIFEKYGPMEDVAIIRDKHTGQHRGCAFVTYLSQESADSCERDLHNTFPFEGGKRPVQVRPAGRKEENKVFVGMLPRNVSEEMVAQVFQQFGEVSGVFVIRSTDGYRKGCAFVKFANRDAAYDAIDDLNGKVVFQGSDRPLIVKIADTKGEKRVRHNRGAPGRGGGGGGSVYGSDASDSPGMNGQNMYYMHSPTAHLSMPPAHLYPSQVHHAHAGIPPIDLLNHGSSVAPGPLSFTSFAPAAHGHGHAHGAASPLSQDYMYHQQISPYMAEQAPPHPSAYNNTRPPRGQNQQSANAARPREGPAGANLFIYHLPHDLTDADLATAFNPFGNVISAKVYADKYTGESKGFGFVSYDSVISAEQAIELMNGFQIGNKRLKVQHKRVHHRQAAAPLPNVNVAPNVHAYYQHQQHPQHQQMMYTHQQPPPMPYHDVPVPSIEIQSKMDDNASTGRTMSSVNTLLDVQTDIDALTQSFSGLQPNESNGNA